MKRLALLVPVALFLATNLSAQVLSIESPGGVLAGHDLEFVINVEEAPEEGMEGSVLVDGRKALDVMLYEGGNEVVIADGAGPGAPRTVQVIAGRVMAEAVIDPIPGWLSIVPPVLAIVLALIFKDVLISLFLGVFAGALILFDWNPFLAFARSIDHYMVDAIADADHAAIIVFTTLLGGMVGLITKSGGSEGIVDIVRKWARSRPKGQLATGMMGLFIFFDDYANSLIVGSTMRPITDGLRISREKLAYIVDSTAAPVSSLVPISTWIGFEVGLIAAAFTSLGLPYDGYSTFIASIPYRFYPILALVMVFAIASMNRDFGSMLRAERRAEGTGEVLAAGDVPLADYAQSGMMPPADTPRHAINAIAPILTVIVVTIAGLWITGVQSLDAATAGSGTEYVRSVFESANSYQALMWASLAGVIVALALPAAQRLMPLTSLLSGMVEGFKAMLLALVVLVLAWSIGAVAADLHTADYVVGITESFLSPHLVGVVVFLTAAAIAFATGTSWGTMAILMPLVIPIAHGLSVAAGYAPGDDFYMTFMLGAISSVLAGSVWGDHCSPISDTTILSSMASGCDHVAHVRTQIPYALTVGVLGMIIGDIPTGFGVSPWISLAVGTVIVILIVRFVGKKVEPVPVTAPAEL